MSIQAIILQKCDGQFTMQEAVQTVQETIPVKEPSVRARVYEGLDKGIFTRLARGIYSIVQTNKDGNPVTCLCVNGDGRDLSFLADNSIDCIVTDHPYDISGSLKGGNRDFASYNLFRYTQADFTEKARVLKPGCFLVEFLPEESAENWKYLTEIKQMAETAGLAYYCKVAWKKGAFVANTGRKSKNAEDILLFSNGKARNLRPDAKKDKANPEEQHFMSGANGMLPTLFDVQPPSKSERIHQAEKPVHLLQQILDFITMDGECVLDQFAGSGALGEAAMEMGRNSILIEQDEIIFGTMKQRIEAFG